jgi:sec-independent protein translocase protein TatA
MGLSGLSLGHMLVVLLVVILVFGTRKLGDVGADLGAAIKNFRKAMATDDSVGPQAPASEGSVTGELLGAKPADAAAGSRAASDNEPAQKAQS